MEARPAVISPHRAAYCPCGAACGEAFPGTLPALPCGPKMKRLITWFLCLLCVCVTGVLWLSSLDKDAQIRDLKLLPLRTVTEIEAQLGEPMYVQSTREPHLRG